MKNLLWAIFGNDEDWPVPYWYVQRFNLCAENNGYQDIYIKFRWLLRNPLHNFAWRVIGVHGKDWVRVGIDPERSYALKGGWQWCVIRYKWWRLPYVSYINRVFRFRMGWGDAGNFTPLSIRSTRPSNITWGKDA